MRKQMHIDNATGAFTTIPALTIQVGAKMDIQILLGGGLERPKILPPLSPQGLVSASHNAV